MSIISYHLTELQTRWSGTRQQHVFSDSHHIEICVAHGAGPCLANGNRRIKPLMRSGNWWRWWLQLQPVYAMAWVRLGYRARWLGYSVQRCILACERRGFDILIPPLVGLKSVLGCLRFGMYCGYHSSAKIHAVFGILCNVCLWYSQLVSTSRAQGYGAH